MGAPSSRNPFFRRSGCRSWLALTLGLAGFTRLSAAPDVVATPLAPRSTGTGSTLFTPIPADVSGLQHANTYADPKMRDDLFAEFAYGAIGTGLGVNDYDGDGRPDLFVVTKTGQSRLYRNLGGLRFEDVTERAGLIDREPLVWKQGVAFVDANSDGRPDLFLCRYQAPNQLWINQGDGTFREEGAARGVATTDASGMAYFCDYDTDGHLDFYLLTNVLSSTASPEGRPDRLFHNRGDGTFAEVTEQAGIRGNGFGHSAAWWDYNEDGRPDLYVANDFAGIDALYRNDGYGKFTDVIETVPPYISYSSMGSDVADVDGDGHLDLFVAEMAATHRQTDQMTMAESRAQLNRPGATAQQTLRQVMRNVLFLGTGGEHVREAASLAGLAATDWTWSPRWADFDNDGRVDLWVTNGMVLQLHNADLHARLRAAERPEDRLRLYLSMPLLEETNFAFRNEGDLSFRSTGAAWGLDQKGVSFGSVTADFDGDGDLDVAFANYQAPPTLVRNDSTEGQRLLVELIGRDSNAQGWGTEVTVTTPLGAQTQVLQAGRGYLSTSEPRLHFGLGAADRVLKVEVRWPSGKRQRLTDLAVDQRLQLTEPATTEAIASAPKETALPSLTDRSRELAPDLRSKETSLDEPLQPALLPFRLNRRGPAMAVADLDGDGQEELVVGGATQQPLRAWSLHARAPWQALALVTEPAKVNDGPVLVADLNGDGRQDVLATRGGITAAAGTEAFSPTYLFQQSTAWLTAPAEAWPAAFRGPVGALVTADFDHDGDLDLFVGGRAQPRRFPAAAPSGLLLNDGKGNFSDASRTWFPAATDFGIVGAALATDVDNDGWADLLLASAFGGVRFFRNDAGRGFVERTHPAGFDAAGTGPWTSLAAGDFNRDGQLDYVVGNWGLNTPYRASPEQPWWLLAGDFKGGGANAILEAQSEDGHLWPLRARSELMTVLPDLLKKATTTDAFSSRSLEDLVPPAKLAAARRLAVTQLSAGIYLSQPDGRVSFQLLPRVAQLGPWQGVLVEDENGDGNLDLLVVGGSRAPVPSIGPFEGGLGTVLLGDGTGRFSEASPTETGWQIPGDAETVVRVPIEGRDHFVVAKNTEPFQILSENEAGRWLRVRLQGKAGNTLGFGSRIHISDTKGVQFVREITGPGGGLGQSTPEVRLALATLAFPIEIQVRWPDGRETHATIPAPTERLTLAAP